MNLKQTKKDFSKLYGLLFDRDLGGIADYINLANGTMNMTADGIYKYKLFQYMKGTIEDGFEHKEKGVFKHKEVSDLYLIKER